ncbi:microtubule-associated protein futsch-like [Diaphorina citri]|uniref:Microtubule-associated protein futsch-like n=1 Tax=Diaphorina citri TaxID=121845 RepID=A0A3Q0IZ20_DIACI|nr:microtubule-associated protein futsch-like [Diaphorina citri]
MRQENKGDRGKGDQRLQGDILICLLHLLRHCHFNYTFIFLFPALNLDLNLTQAAQDKDETAEAKDDLKDDVDVVKESTPKKKDKTSGSELSSEDIGKGAQKDSDDKKDEKIISTIESGQTTTAPTLPEDERIPLDEIKEEKVNVDAIPGKKIDIKREAHISKIQTGIVKTPDEVADLPVHEEVDATDYEDIEKKDEGIEEMEEEEVLEEQEGSADIMKGSISVITTTRESDDILNDGDDGEKITEKTEDEVKITDEKGSEDSKEVLDKLSKEKINEEKLKSEKSADEVKGKEMKEEKVVSDEKLEKDMINIAKIEGTVTSKEESNIADEVKEKLEEVKKSEELVEQINPLKLTNLVLLPSHPRKNQKKQSLLRNPQKIQRYSNNRKSTRTNGQKYSI